MISGLDSRWSLRYTIPYDCSSTELVICSVSYIYIYIYILVLILFLYNSLWIELAICSVSYISSYSFSIHYHTSDHYQGRLYNIIVISPHSGYDTRYWQDCYSLFARESSIDSFDSHITCSLFYASCSGKLVCACT